MGKEREGDRRLHMTIQVVCGFHLYLQDKWNHTNMIVTPILSSLRTMREPADGSTCLRKASASSLVQIDSSLGTAVPRSRWILKE